MTPKLDTLQSRSLITIRIKGKAKTMIITEKGLQFINQWKETRSGKISITEYDEFLSQIAQKLEKAA